MDKAPGGVIGIRVSDGKEIVVRPPDRGIGTIHSLSGPNRDGMVAFIENRMRQDKHYLKTIRLDGSEERIILERRGDAMWESAVGTYMALSDVGDDVAFLGDLRTVDGPLGLRKVGSIMIVNTRTARMTNTKVEATDSPLRWCEAGRTLLFVNLVPEAEAEGLLPWADGSWEFEQDFRGSGEVPAVHILEVNSARAQPILLGKYPAVTEDGRLVLACDSDSHWIILDRVDNRATIFQPPLGAYFSDLAFFMTDTSVLFQALPTAGQTVPWTKSNSPFIGPKQMMSIKVLDLETGSFQTIIPFVDPRRRVSFGHVDKLGG